MLADRLKTMREAKAWSQDHLARAAGLNVRTVQRIEAGEPASHETLLSLAAALDVNICELEPDERMWAGRVRLSPSRAALAALLVVPALLFVLVNMLRSIAGLNGPFDFLAREGARLMSFETFNLLSPVIFLGGAAAGLILCLPVLVRLRTGKNGRGTVSINGIELRTERLALGIAAAAILSGGILVAYTALEQLRTIVR